MTEAAPAEPVLATPEGEPLPLPSSNTPAPAPEPSEAPEQVGADGEPLAKKRKISESDTDKLENRLGGILCCAVCLDLPPAAVYQCTNGHLMCAPCFVHLLADARLRDEAATCPNCRVEISKQSASRNLAVEKTISELPADCKYCTQVFARHALDYHEEKLCEERLTGCRYVVIGCPWRGPWHEAAAHAACCAAPRRSAADVLAALAERERGAADHQQRYQQLLDLLSLEKITINDLQLKPYRSEEFVNTLYYESSRFTAFNQQWVVKAFVNKHQRDPTQSSQREITYQLILKSKAGAVPLQWVVVRGPFGEARLRARVLRHSFRDDAPDAPPAPLPLHDPADTNRLLANKAIHFRLIMFLSPKA